MIYLWPHLREQIDSKKTPEEIYMILQSVTDSRKTFLWNPFEAVLTGNLEEKMFIMVPIAFTIGGQVLPRCSFYGSAKKALKRLKELLC